MIEATCNYIRKSLAGAKNPAMLCSFGKESMLLLTLVRQIKPDIAIFWFGDHLSTFGESVIKDQGLQVFSYAPADRYIAGNSLIDEYSLGGMRVPMVSDMIEGKPCELEKLSSMRTPLFNYQSDVTFYGYRRDDSHSLIQTTFPQRFALGGTIMDAPLYDYSEANVLNALNELNVNYDLDTNSITVCATCQEEIDATLDRENSINYFRERFGFEGSH